MRYEPLMKRYCRLIVFLGMALIGGAAATGCGVGDPCSDVTCGFGVCDGETGQCTNASSCRTDGQCIPGYECGRDGSCQALTECETDKDCEAGVCSDEGACVNPETCSKNSDCLARTFCAKAGDGDKGTCEPDPCNDVTCRRGVCQRGTDNCVSAESCTEETELLDCVSGEKCAEGTCEPPENFCESLTCERGVCSFEAGGCVDANDCKGKDKNCLPGKFCNEMGQCRPNLCERNEVDCEGNGVCVPSTGTCQNAESCETSEDCVADHVCVEGTCRLAAVACGNAGGDGGCPGNQTCRYDAANQTATCEEPADCETSFDCNGDRQCGGRMCLEPDTCSADLFEPNDAAGEATTFAKVAADHAVSASICQDDTDVYKVDSTKLLDATTRGTMLVEVDVPPRARGLGKLTLTVRDPGGNKVGTASTGAMGADGNIQVPVEIEVPDHGTYTVEVTGAGELNKAGVDYDLSADVIPLETLEACKAATPIRVNQRLSGNTNNGKSTRLGSSCTSQASQSNERIYRLDVDAPQEVNFRLEPLISSADLTMSLRRRCTQIGTEKACSDAAGKGRKESLTALIGEGTYYLVVQPSQAGEGGPFNLTVDRVYTACSARDDYCDRRGRAHICTSDGGRFKEIECDAGCNPSTGRCHPPEGDTCLDAPTITPQGGSTYEVDLTQLTDDYDLQGAGCVAQRDPRTSGPDMSYEVAVPANTAMTAEVLFDNEVEGAMYLVDDCNDPGGTCEIGAQGSTDRDDQETFTYTNRSDSEATYHLILDTEEGQQFAGAELYVSYADVVCTPGEKKCSGNGHVVTCGEHGRTFKQTADCGVWGCSGASCQRPDTCQSAVDATSAARQGVTYSGVWGNFKNDYESDDTCNRQTLSNGDTSGRESVYKVNLQKDEVLRGKLTGAGETSLYLKSAGDCGTSRTSCPAFADASSDPAVIHYLSEKAQTLYVVVERQNNATGSFQLSLEIQQKQCTPGNSGRTCTSSRNLQYCTDYGRYGTYKCHGGCTNGECQTPKGEMCFDAIPMSDGDSDTRVLNGMRSLEIYPGTYGDCTFQSWSNLPVSPDRIYEIEVPAGKELSVDWSTGRLGQFTFSGLLYLLDTCGEIDSCLATTQQELSHRGKKDALTYENTTGQTQTVYLYAAKKSNFYPSADYTVETHIK